MDRERITAIIGEPGTGKSRLARVFMRDERRLVLIDTMMEHDEFRHVDLYEIRDLIEDDGPFRVRVVPSSEEEMDWLCKMAAWRPRLCIVVEEYNFHWSSAQTKPPKGLLDIVRVGRKLDQSAILITQSPASIDKTFLEFGSVFCFRLRGLRARKYIRDFTDGEADPGHLAYTPGDTSECWFINMGVPTRMMLDLASCALTVADEEDSLPGAECDESGNGAAEEQVETEGAEDEGGREAGGDHGSRGAGDDGRGQAGEAVRPGIGVGSLTPATGPDASEDD